MLTAVYYILRDEVDYRELRPLHFERLERKKVTQRLLTDLGCAVQDAVAAESFVSEPEINHCSEWNGRIECARRPGELL